MSAHTTRADAAGNVRDAHSSGVASRASGRFCTTAILRSRQPFSRVFTLPASTLNSKCPTSAAKVSAESVSPACQRTILAACRSQYVRIRLTRYGHPKEGLQVIARLAKGYIGRQAADFLLESRTHRAVDAKHLISMTAARRAFAARAPPTATELEEPDRGGKLTIGEAAVFTGLAACTASQRRPFFSNDLQDLFDPT